MITLGPGVLRECLLPQMKDYAKSVMDKYEECETEEDEEDLLAGEKKRTILGLLLGSLKEAARMLVNSSGGKRTKEDSEIYEMLSETFGDSLCLVNPGPTRLNVEIPAPETVGKLKIRRLDNQPAMNGTSKKPHVSTSGSGRSNSLSSTQDFDSLADLGVPTDIFEPADSTSGVSPEKQLLMARSQQSRVDSLTPRKLSAAARMCFEGQRDRTVCRYKPVVVEIAGASAWGRERLKRPAFQFPVRLFDAVDKAKVGTKAYVGKRRSYPRTTERFKVKRLYSCSLYANL